MCREIKLVKDIGIKMNRSSDSKPVDDGQERSR